MCLSLRGDCSPETEAAYISYSNYIGVEASIKLRHTILRQPVEGPVSPQFYLIMERRNYGTYKIQRTKYGIC